MSEPFLGQISIFAFGFAPKGWAQCNGQVMPIAQNQALFALLGTTYGGNGQNTFALPDLRGRVGMHAGRNHPQGQSGGEEAHTLSIAETPSHTHAALCSSSPATTADPSGAFWAAKSGGLSPYASTSNSQCSPQAIAASAGGQPHNNMAPTLTLSFCIALTGIFPSRN
jgi:microcystin-dependent protein